MKYYTVAEIEITDQTWVQDYVTNVTRLIEQKKIEGERKLPQILAVGYFE
jgi:hypothetical protein